MVKYFVCHSLKSVPFGTRATSHPINCTATETVYVLKKKVRNLRGLYSIQPQKVQHSYKSSEALKWLRDSLLELLVIFDPVTDDTDHVAQLSHHILLLHGL